MVSLTLESDPARVHIHIHLLLTPLNSSVSTFKSIGWVVAGQGCHSESCEVDPSPLDLGADFLNFIPFINLVLCILINYFLIYVFDFIVLCY